MAAAARPYTRQGLMEAKQLIPASEGMAAEFGLTLPVAYSLAAWLDSICWPIGYAPNGLAEPQGRREWFLLLSLYDTIHHILEAGGRPPARLDFEHYRTPAEHHITEPRRTRLTAEYGPGDHGEQVVTIMLPSQRVPWSRKSDTATDGETPAHSLFPVRE